jgi:hypothetical protein
METLWNNLTHIVRRIRAPWSQETFENIGMATFALLMVILLFGFASAIFETAIIVIGVFPAQAALAVSVIGIGVLAFLFKKGTPRMYGFVEMIFGAAGAVAVSLRMKPGQQVTSEWAALIAAGYVVARGLGNLFPEKQKSQAAVQESGQIPMLGLLNKINGDLDQETERK